MSLRPDPGRELKCLVNQSLSVKPHNLNAQIIASNHYPVDRDYLSIDGRHGIVSRFGRVQFSGPGDSHEYSGSAAIRWERRRSPWREAAENTQGNAEGPAGRAAGARRGACALGR